MFPHGGDLGGVEEFLGGFDGASADFCLVGREVAEGEVEAGYALDDAFEARVADVFDEGEVSFEVTAGHSDPVVLLDCWNAMKNETL